MYPTCYAVITLTGTTLCHSTVHYDANKALFEANESAQLWRKDKDQHPVVITDNFDVFPPPLITVHTNTGDELYRGHDRARANQALQASNCPTWLHVDDELMDSVHTEPDTCLYEVRDAVGTVIYSGHVRHNATKIMWNSVTWAELRVNGKHETDNGNREKTTWIPVTQSLPEIPSLYPRSEYVLITDGKEIVVGALWGEDRCLPCKWFERDSERELTTLVTHWMNLPELP